MAERATELKPARTQRKTQVTTAAKRLSGAIKRNADKVCIQKFYEELETSMADFALINDEYNEVVNEYELQDFKIVNGLDLEKYEQGVNETYEKAIEEFKECKKAVITPLISRLDTSKSRLSRLCEKTKALVEDKGIGMSSQLFDGLNKQFTPLIQEIQLVMTQLSELQDPVSFSSTQTEIDELLGECDSLQLECNLAIHRSQHSVSVNSVVESPVVAHSMQFSGGPSVPIQNESTPLDGGHTLKRNTEAKCDVQVKKLSLPVFSGNRVDWPEFKVVWRELAEKSFNNKTALAFELKRSLKGTAKDKVKNVYVTRDNAYDTMWERLTEYYDDVSAGVSAALDCLKRLKAVKDDDYKGLVNLIDEVESVHSQLEEMGQVETLSAREVDSICELLPSTVRMVWNRSYYEFSVQDKIKPFSNFMKFLLKERAAIARLAEGQKSKRVHSDTNSAAVGKLPNKQFDKFTCVVHKGDSKHKTADCKNFKALSLDDKFSALREAHVCFRCFGSHRRDQCRSSVKCDVCKKANHHTLMCKSGQNAQTEFSEVVSPKLVVAGSSHLVKAPAAMSLYAIQQAFIVNSGKLASVFCDNGSNTSYITHRAAERLRAKRLDKFTLDITTMGNVSREYETRLYEVMVRTVCGEIVQVLAFGIETITGSVSSLDLDCLSHIFPDRDVSLLQRKSATVDMLLGCDYFSLHPKREVYKQGNLSIMQGELGICLIGSHPDLKEDTEISCNMIKVVHDQRVKSDCNFVLHKQILQPNLGQAGVGLKRTCEVNFLSKKVLDDASAFIESEQMATGANPKCGGCKCGKCPSVGHTYSFKEEQELRMIQDNLRYSKDECCWYTSYPWLVDPGQLPDNFNVALATLRNTEKTLSKDPQWSEKYAEQIGDMLKRGVARKLSEQELSSWGGPKFYISHLAVNNPKSQSTPIRIVFNSSQNCNGVSLNSTLAKGPDGYMNNLLGLLLRWREEPVAVVGDIRKMFHSVKLETLEQHCHRFLWRDLDTTRDPDVYIMLRVNMGDTPAPAICTEALYKTAEMFGDQSAEAVHMITKSTYVDDVVASFQDRETAESVVKETEQILRLGGFSIKCWLYSGESEISSELKSAGTVTRVLGVDWDSKNDVIVFQPVVNFSPKRRGERTGPNLTISDIPDAIPQILTRRMVLEQVMSIFDPLGILSPITMIAKLYLRETWVLKLGWDEELPPGLYQKWMLFFRRLFDLSSIAYDRKLRPENAVGRPWLVILSDASDLAYGFVAYVRWQVDDGSYWCQLVMAKSRIAPVRKLSTPQLELNAAVLSARARKVLEKESRFRFERVLHMVDSETVLNMINKTSTRFKVYEGVRIGEIQAATDGNMTDWAWLAGSQNVADWVTRGKEPKDLGPTSDWCKGPSFMYHEFEEWPVKFGLQRDVSLPGEKKLACTAAALALEATFPIDFTRFSSVRKLYWVLARLLNIARMRSFKGGSTRFVTVQMLQKAEQLILKEVQRSSVSEFADVKGHYKALTPVTNAEGIWVVGKRLSNKNPMTPEGEAQALLPRCHPVTHLLMRDAHVASGHRGRDATLARFRSKYWTAHGSKLAWSVKIACQLCKLRDVNFLEQEMGKLPESRLKPAPAFTNVMLDLFGPYKIKGEVQKRTSGKAYGILFTDMSMRAVHIEGVFGYDTDSFLVAFNRFVSIRGWPCTIYSDPGSQLVGVERELRSVWSDLDQDKVVKKSVENGLTWVFGPADAPWYQGAVESLVKSAKRALNFAFHNQRLSAAEFLSACYEVANMLNERPIGTMPGADAEISILTPNSLLLGRASIQNPGGWQPITSDLCRFQVVQMVSKQFWQRWCELCAPALLIQRKWHTARRNLQPGDVVIVADKNTLKGQYRIALVKKVFPGNDGIVRKVSLTYKNFKVGERLNVYTGVSDTEITRSVHKLSLLVPCDDN